MKICIDARYLSSRPSGIGRYSANLLRELERLDRENEYVVFVHDSYEATAEAAENFRYVASPHRPVSWGTLFKMGRLIDAERSDLVHSLNPVVPLRLSTPLVITIHDWQPLSVPGFSGMRPRPIEMGYDFFYRRHYPYAVRKARRVIAVSEFARRETERYVPSAAGKCGTILSGLDGYFRSAPTGDEISRTIDEHDLPENYILYVGSTRPNKQLPTLLRAFDRVIRGWDARGDHRNVPSDLELVLAVTPDRFFVPCRALIDELSLGGRVRILENLNDAALKVLYRRARAVSMATIDEGFGFPVLEAMAQGTPVVISDRGALRELAGDSAVCVPAEDPGELARAIETTLNGSVMGNETAPGDSPGETTHDLRRLDRFDWSRTAREVLAVYGQVGSGC